MCCFENIDSLLFVSLSLLGIVISGGGVTLIGNGSVLILFGSPTAREVTAIELIDLTYVEIFGITLNGSSGFLSFTNVSRITIHDSRFR